VTRILIHAQTQQRLSGRLAAIADVDWITMNDEGNLSLRRARIAPEEARLDAAWFSLELYVSPARHVFNRFLLQQPSLRWLQLSGAGIDDPECAELIAAGVRITTHHGHAASIADYVLWSVLDHFQHGPERRTIQSEREWRRTVVRELVDSRWLLLGFGAIGQGIALRARSFGAGITAVRRGGSPHPLADRTASMEELEAILPQTDVVVLCLPLNAATTNLVDSAFLSRLSAGAVLVNVGRGGLVDEAALLTALDAGKPAHAILDVFQTEPLPDTSPLWQHPRVALTCHSASVSDQLFPRADATFFDNLKRFCRGESLMHEATVDELNHFPTKRLPT
jgi:phosphoglycerate dehydrogenase-like enzyme